MGRGLALKLGYQVDVLKLLPTEAIDSFAGVGYHFELADIKPGEKVLDLGSGSGMDVFVASIKASNIGSVTGVDMTDAQLQKAEKLAKINGFENTYFLKSYIEDLPFEEGQFDVVITNGVINLSPDKNAVFNQIGRVLKKGGRLALSDIITESQMPDNIICNSTLWAACIGGAMQQEDYFHAIEEAGLKISRVVENEQYGFISKSAIGASKDYGVKSISLLAKKS
jgi:ubiquinone/menaquinone biosynthesis C-methylase UbiE